MLSASCNVGTADQFLRVLIIDMLAVLGHTLVIFSIAVSARYKSCLYHELVIVVAVTLIMLR